MLQMQTKESKALNIITHINTPKEWQVVEGTYSCDDLIDAYLKGKQDRLIEIEKAMYKNLTENAYKTCDIVFEVINKFKKSGFKPKDVFLNIISWDYFKALILISERDFLSDGFLKMYNYISEVEKNNKTDYFRIEFMVSDTENFLPEKAESDGFIIKQKI